MCALSVCARAVCVCFCNGNCSYLANERIPFAIVIFSIAGWLISVSIIAYFESKWRIQKANKYRKPLCRHTHTHSSQARQTERERERLEHACALCSSSIKRKQQQAAQYTHAYTHSLDTGQGVAGKQQQQQCVCVALGIALRLCMHAMHMHSCVRVRVRVKFAVCLMCWWLEENELEDDCRRFNWYASWVVAAALLRYCIYQSIEAILVLLADNCRRQHWQLALLGHSRTSR